MDGPRHKRPRSTSGPPAPSPAVTRSWVKKRSKPSLHGKFQAPGKPKIEKKNFDLATGSLPTTLPSPATATGVLLNAYNVGTTANGAIGRRVLNRSLLLRMSIKIADATNSPSTACRVAVVYDREANGAAPAITDVWGTGAAQGTTCAANLDNADRFSILLDEKFTLQGIATNGAPVNYVQLQSMPYYLDRYVKVSLESVAKSNAFNGGISGIATGSIYLFAWSDIAAASNPPQVVAALSRVRFSDG